MISKCMIIAEISANHDGDIEIAKETIRAAKRAGADAIKMQTYKPETITLNCKNDDFKVQGGTIWDGKFLHDLYQEASLPWEWHKELFDQAKKEGLICFSTPFDFTAVDFLEELDCPIYKVASFEITHLPLIEKIAKTKKPIIISTGMATKKEISEAIQTVRKYNNKKIILMKCTSEYPADPKYSNLKTIVDMRKSFKCEIGLSDHTIGIGCAISSINHGASVIEKHFTINKKDGGIDSPFSLEPFELKMLVSESKRAWLSNGKVSYGPSKNEKKSLVFRRSIFLNK